MNTLYRIAAVLSLPMDYFFPSNHANEAQPVSDAIVDKTPSELRKERKESDSATTRDVFQGDVQISASPVMPATGRPTIELMGGVSWSRLTHEAEEGIEFLEIVYAVGAKSGNTMSHHSGREFGLVLEGTLLLELGFEEYELGPGDSIIFDSSNPHRLSNGGEQPVRAFWVVLDHQ